MLLPSLLVMVEEVLGLGLLAGEKEEALNSRAAAKKGEVDVRMCSTIGTGVLSGPTRRVTGTREMGVGIGSFLRRVRLEIWAESE